MRSGPPRAAALAQAARVSLGDLHLEGEYALLVGPAQPGVALRY
jgi:hypothetical protein